MNKLETLNYLKRWEKVKARELTQHRRASFKERFIQASALMQFARSLKKNNKQKNEDLVRSHWKKLREAYI
ncbi:MAG: hypothetical protein KAV18_07940 [Candidatus Omnitrophica bacterium]|nr:hypothetical protein [Candidatus Omnitrophota bacterium]